jgi:hypothetical protein
MHGFVHAETLDIRKLDTRETPLWHLLGIVETLEGDIPGVRERVGKLDQSV